MHVTAGKLGADPVSHCLAITRHIMGLGTNRPQRPAARAEDGRLCFENNRFYLSQRKADGTDNSAVVHKQVGNGYSVHYLNADLQRLLSQRRRDSSPDNTRRVERAVYLVFGDKYSFLLVLYGERDAPGSERFIRRP